MTPMTETDRTSGPTVENETCAECRFDAAAYTDLDVGGALRAITPWWRIAVRDRGEELFARPREGTWSAYEYAVHTREVLELLRLGIDWLLAEDGVQYPAIEPPAVTAIEARGDVNAEIDRIERVALALNQYAADRSIMQSPNRAMLAVDDIAVDAPWILRHAVHDALHHLRDIARGFVALGVGTPAHVGSVVQINTSDGGVPKLPVTDATVGYRGIAGDRQRARLHHGRVFQALCLASIEAIERLHVEGHPIEAGAAGENFTLAGIDWPALRPGTRLHLGTAVIELSVPAVPCAKNAQWFSDRDFGRLHHDHHPGETRWYASVMSDGHVQVGDRVEVEPE
jgi:MOSC domain-containing protein YiiM